MIIDKLEEIAEKAKIKPEELVSLNGHPAFYTQTAAAEAIQKATGAACGRHTIRRWIKKGILKTVTLKDRDYIPHKQVAAIISAWHKQIANLGEKDEN